MAIAALMARFDEDHLPVGVAMSRAEIGYDDRVTSVLTCGPRVSAKGGGKRTTGMMTGQCWAGLRARGAGTELGRAGLSSTFFF